MTDKMPARIDIRLAPPAGLTREAPFVEEVPAAGATEGDDAFDLIEVVRNRLELDQSMPDVTIAASLAQIAAKGDARGRWLAAFGSPLGKHLAMRGSDLNTALNVLLALAPRQSG